MVSFVRKRDKRVQAYKKQLEERAAFNRQKQEQNRMEQIRRRQQELEEMRQNSKSAHSDDYEEQLKQLEQEYSSGDNEDEEDIEEDGEPIGEEQDDADGEEELYDDLYCVACNKAFKNENAFANHETSKKHRENIGKLKLQMREEESLYQPQDKESEEEIDMENNAQEGIGEEVMHNSDGKELEVDVMPKHKTKFPKSRNKKDYKKSKLSLLVNSDEDNENVLDDIVIQASKLDIAPDNDENDEWDKTIRKHTKKSKNKNKNGNGKNKVDFPEAEPSKKDEIKNLSTKPTSKTNIECMSNIESDKTQHICVTCKSHFESKNKLFSHLKLSNHGVYIPKTKKNDDEVGRNKKGKGKKK